MNRTAAVKHGPTVAMIVSILAILGGLYSIGKDQGAMQAKLDATAQDVAMIKQKLIPDATHAESDPYIENADGLIPIVDEPKTTWAAAYLHDHCKRCPECCPKVAAGAWP